MTTTRQELKVQALLERISQLTASYENQAADYRVEITELASRLGQYEDAEGNRIVQEDQGSAPSAD
jgi:hypothetical protein